MDVTVVGGWWLRCRGNHGGNYVADVYGDGYVDAYGYNADRDYGGVRVALQWNLES